MNRAGRGMVGGASRCWLLCAVGCVAIASPGSSQAAPQIQSELTYIENRPPDDIFGFPGLYVLTRCNVTDPGGVTALIGPPANATVTADNNDFPLANPALMDFVPVDANGGFFIHLFPIAESDFPAVEGRFAYDVFNNSGQHDGQNSHRLNRLEVVPHPTNLSVSDQTTTPTFSFTDPDPSPNVSGLDRGYQVVIYDASLNFVAILPSSATYSAGPSFTIPGGVLCPCGQYYFRAQSVDVDTADDDVENMGQSFLFFSPTDVSTKTGDANHDCSTNGRDVQPFVTAMLSASTAVDDVCPADFDLSGTIDIGDMTPFVNQLLSP